ncbi:Mov34/MPN/PAD-1 family protein [Apiospora arundinis]|uniref:Mov34/MPN/PAD-1 family protein n=1 Tax=Apiospora arundinis TaxID=335852 RepID=A0ABR2JBL4_9PEZI
MGDLERPLSVKEISQQAQVFDFNPNVPLRSWLRTANMLHREAEAYLRDGNWAKAYMMYMRYMLLLMDHLQKHPDLKKDKDSRLQLKKALGGIESVLANLERIKPILSSEYDKWIAGEEKRKERYEKLKSEGKRNKTPYEKHASNDPSLSASGRILDAGEHQDLAVVLAQREMKRRDAGRKATRQAGVSAEEEQERRTAGFWDNWTHELAKKQAEDDDLFRQQMELTRKKLDGEDDTHIQNFLQKMSRGERELEAESNAYQGTPAAYNYPSISKSQPVSYDAQSYTSRPEPPNHAPPPPPPKESVADLAAPERPSKELYSTPPPSLQVTQPQDGPQPPPKISEMPASPPPSSKRLTFAPAAYLENGEPIRSIFLPGQLRNEFLRIASDNTRRGLEMCGILCGTAVNNALFIKCLVIPEQKCTSDTCETENESELFDYCMTEDLLMLGWIHTHPTQSCFMSSRDLHTQAGYQVMLPESIAIVCAPKFQPSYGIFRLTNPPGLPHILHCNETATFHQHSIDNLYTGAEKPAGHVFESDKLNFEIKDLRPAGTKK